MKEKRDAHQAYKSAMDKMKMPARLETDKKITMSGSGGIKMKSKALAFAAAAAVLVIFVGIGAFILSRNSDETIKIGSSKDMTLETDDTIPSGEITSVEQAVSEHQKCELLYNDEYIKLKAGRDNITKQMADSFFERTEKISERNEKCLNYISETDSAKTLFVHAIKFDDGCIDLEYHLDSQSWEKFDKLYEKGYSYYICKADSGEKLLRCVNQYRASPKDLGASAAGSKADPADLEKLTGKLSYVMIGSDEMNEKEIVLKEFEFFDKTFIGGDERAELKQLADKARNGKDEKSESYPINVKLMDMRADAHGIVVKLTAKPNSEQGAELIRKYGKKNDISKCEIFPTGESSDDLQQIAVISGGYNYSVYQQHCFVTSSSTEKGEEYIDYICYIPLRKTPPENTAFDIYLKTTSPYITDKDVEDGRWKNSTVGKITVKYNRNTVEKLYTTPSGKKIYLSDLYFTVPDYCEKGNPTLKYTDGTQRVVYSSDLCIWKYLTDEKDKDLFKQSVEITVKDDNIRANFFKDAISTSNVISVTYAGEEYTLAQTAEDKQSDYPIKVTASDFYCAPHGIKVRLTLSAAGDEGRQILTKHFDSAGDGGVLFLGTVDGAPLIVGSDGYKYAEGGYRNVPVGSDEQKQTLTYDCFIPLSKAPNEQIDFELAVRAEKNLTPIQQITAETPDVRVVGKIKLTYKPNDKEQLYTAGDGSTITLSDIYFKTSASAENVKNMVLKNKDGSEKHISAPNDFSQLSGSEDTVVFTNKFDTANVEVIECEGKQYKLTKQ